MATMIKAWRYTAIKGTLEASISLTDVPMPTKESLQKGQLIVKVLSAAINPVDYIMPESNLASLVVSPPATPGPDFCGKIVHVHPSETVLKPGELVMALPRGQ